MFVKSITLQDFRNYDHLEISLAPGLNVLVGKNAQGKTNLLESIFLCAIGRSARTSKDKEMIAFGKHSAKVMTTLDNKGSKRTIEIYLFDNRKKAIKIGGVPILKMGELLGELNAVYFSPDELKLVKDSPQERRRFLDISLSQYDRNYFYALSKYNKILEQRNTLLKSRNSVKETISIWDEQLAIVGAKVIEYRLQLVEQLTVIANRAQQYLTGNHEELQLSYSSIAGLEQDNIKEQLLDQYAKTLEKDIELGYTTVGPHRDDLKIVVNGIDMRYYGSQGQQRTCALALKLAELEIFKQQRGEYPILLLDDVLSELDQTRREKLLQYVTRLQTILTCTDFEYDVACNRYHIENGRITKMEEVL